MVFDMKHEQIKLSEEQERVFYGIFESLEKVVVLQGAAGTGKGVVIRELLKTGHYVSLASTNQAARAVYGMTVNKALKTVPYYDKRGNLRFDMGTAPEDLVGTSVIVDEAFMLTSPYVAALLEICRQVVLVGDGNQLPPVGEQESVIPSLDGDFFTLETVRRYDGEILELATQCLDAECIGDLLDIWVSLPKGKIDHSANFICLSYTNKAIRENWVNHCKVLGRPVTWQVGDRCIVLPTSKVAAIKQIYNNDCVTIERFNSGSEYDVAITLNETGEKNYLMVHNANSLRTMEEKSTALKENPEATGTDWAKMFNEYQDLCKFLPSAFRTVHRSQGMTIPLVYLSKDILSCRDFAMAKQLLYTALTRTSGEIYTVK
jgi:ATP-dependent exoDNAse (exonuclease V) alpha subunit